MVLLHTRPHRAAFSFAIGCLLITSTLAAAQDDTVNTIPLPATPDEAPVTPAPAEPAPVQLQEVEVTGSRIRRADYETAQPLLSINRKDIERSGLTSIGQLLQDLPQAGSALGTTFNNGGTGATEVDLRNLGSNRVLVLVNGHRWVNGLRNLSTSSVDLNTIPISIIERVEVLKDGASAVYGSDAIAGVVNIITRKDFQGTLFSTQVGSFLQGDGAQQEHNLAFGNLFDNRFGATSVFANISFRDQQPIFAPDREISKLPKVGTGLTRASSFLPEGRFLFVPNAQNGVLLGVNKCGGLAGDVAGGTADGELGPGSTPTELVALGNSLPGVQLCDLIHIAGNGNDSASGDFRKFQDPADRYNYASTNYLSTPLRNYSGFLSADHKFNEYLGVQIEALYSRRESRQVLAPQPICVGNLCPVIGGQIPGTGLAYNQATYVPANSPFNPFNQDIGRTDPNDATNVNPCFGPISDPLDLGLCTPAVGLIGQGAILRRMQDFGPRIQEQIVPTMFGHVAFNGDFTIPDKFQKLLFTQLSAFHWEVGYGYGQSTQDQTLFNQIDVSHLQKALGPASECTGDCVPVNFFGGQGSMTPAMLGYLGFNAMDYTEQIQNDIYGNIGFNVENLLPAGDLGLAFGFEMRTDEYAFLPDSHSLDGTTSGLTADVTRGKVTATEYFGELSVPILKNLPYADTLDLSLAGRVSEYETFGNSFNYKVGLKYKPVADLLLRSTYATSFRAPDVGNLYLGLQASFPALADPCVTGADAARQPGNDIDQNCTADGVPSSFTQQFAQTLSPYGGNPDLKPETSRSLTFGGVYSPDFAPGLELGIDYYNITLRNYITAPDPQGDILDRCYKVAPSARSQCQFVSRSPATKQLDKVLDLFTNFPKVETAGIDYNISYVLPSALVPEGFGAFKIVTDATYLAKYNEFTEAADGSLIQTQRVGSFPGVLGSVYPRWKLSPSLQWKSGQFQASWNTRIVWHVTEDCDDGLEPTLKSLNLCSDPNNPAGPKNEIQTGVLNSVQFGYNSPTALTEFTFGVENVFNTDPPVSYSAFANSFISSDYWLPGMMPYIRLKKRF